MTEREFLTQIIENLERRHSCFDPEIERFYEMLKAKKYLCLFGAGMVAGKAASIFMENGVSVDFLCDNDGKKAGKEFFGIKCISYEDLKKIKKDTVVFISTSYFVEIADQLRQDGVDHFIFSELFLPKFDVKAIFQKDKEKILPTYDMLEDELSRKIFLAHILHASDSTYYSMFRKLPYSPNQYFDEDVVSLGENETLVDVGSFDGADSIRFVKQVNEKFNRIYCFELSKNNFNLLTENISKLSPSVNRRITCINKGVSDTTGSFPYVDDFGSGNSLVLNNDNKANNIASVIKLDDFFYGKKDSSKQIGGGG